MKMSSTSLRLILAFSFCFHFIFLGAQSLIVEKAVQNPFDRYKIESWGSKNGFQYTKVNAISQTADGSYWFATPNGIVRFDGRIHTSFTKFTNPEIRNNGISELFTDSQNRLWIGIYGGGLVCYENKKFRTINFGSELAFNEVTSITETADGSIWVGANSDGIAKISDNGPPVIFNTKNGLPSTDIRCLFSGSYGTLWIGTGKGLVKYQNGSFTTLAVSDGLVDNTVTTLAEDSDNSIWIGTRYGISVYKNNQFKTYTISNGLSSNEIKKIIRKNDGGMLIATGTAGLQIFLNEKFYRLTKLNGLTSDLLTTVFSDNNFNIWTGTASNGMNVLKKQSETTISTSLSASGFIDKKGPFVNYKLVKMTLPDNQVNSVLFSKEGYLWVGTKNGLQRFDGEQFIKFENFGLTGSDENGNENISDLFEDHSGKLWIGTSGGGLLYAGRESITSFDLGKNNPFRVVSSITETSDSSIWIGSLTEGICAIKNDSVSFLTVENGLPTNSIRSLFTAKNGTTYIGTTSGLFFSRNNRSVFTEIKGLSSPDIWAISEDQSGNIYVGTSDGLNIIKSDGIVILKKKDGIADNHIRKIAVDAENNVWVATKNGGVNLISKSGIFTYNSQNGLSSDLTTSITTDSNQNIWIGTYGEGINRLNRTIFSSYSSANGLSSALTSAVISDQTDGSLWIGTFGSGLNHVKDGVITSYSKRNGLSDDYVTALLQDKAGRIWIGTQNGLNVLNGKKLTVYDTNSGLSGNEISSIAESPQGNIYIGTENSGLNLFKNGAFLPVNKSDGLTSKNINSLAVDKNGSVWVGTNGKGLFLYKSGVASRIDALINDGEENTIYKNFNRIFFIYEDRIGNILVCLNNGEILKIVGEKEVSRYQIEDLKSKPILNIIQDNNDNYWISSGNGLYLVNQQEFLSAAEPSSRNKFPLKKVAAIKFNESDGLANTSFLEHQTISAKGKNNRLFFATQSGLSILNADWMKITFTAPDVRIDKFTTENYTSIIEKENSSIEVSNIFETYEFHYSVTDLLGKEKVQYRYKLDGLDEDWQLAGSRQVAYYTNLPPGEYEFKVEACNINGEWNGTVSQVSLKILPKWWQTIWAYISYLLIAVFGVMWVLKYNDQKMYEKVEQQSVRDKEVADKIILHNEIKRKTKELEFARKVQLSMLPKENIDNAYIETVGKMVTASEVGGDYYDFIDMKDGRLCLAVGDATGHGVAAGLLVGMVKMALVNSLSTSQGNLSTKDMIENLNYSLKQTVSQRGMGMCILISYLNLKTGEIEISSNGMPYPYHYRRSTNQIEIVKLEGLPIGFLKNIIVQTKFLKLESDDLLIFLSDGIPERINLFQEQWGYEKVMEELKLICEKETNPDRIADRLLAECNAFARNREHDDDMTVVVMKVK